MGGSTGRMWRSRCYALCAIAAAVLLASSAAEKSGAGTARSAGGVLRQLEEEQKAVESSTDLLASLKDWKQPVADGPVFSHGKGNEDDLGQAQFAKPKPAKKQGKPTAKAKPKQKKGKVTTKMAKVSKLLAKVQGTGKKAKIPNAKKLAKKIELQRKSEQEALANEGMAEEVLKKAAKTGSAKDFAKAQKVMDAQKKEGALQTLKLLGYKCKAPKGGKKSKKKMSKKTSKKKSKKK